MGPRRSRFDPIGILARPATLLLASLVLVGCPWPFLQDTLRPEMFTPAQVGGLKVSLLVEGLGRDQIAMLRISVNRRDGQPLTRRNLSGMASARAEEVLGDLPAGGVVVAAEALDAEGGRLAQAKRDAVVEAGGLSPVQVILSGDEPMDSPASEPPSDEPAPLPTTKPPAPGPSDTFPDAFSGGPMVFTPRTRYTYEVKAINGLLPLGVLELRVERFVPQAHAIRLGVETSQIVWGIRDARTYEVEVDADWIYADGKPFLPQRATPGLGWPSIEGQAGFVRYEDVDSPAGKFRACWRVAYFQGSGEPSLFWFAPGKGLVRAEFPHSLGRLVATVTRIEP